MTVRGLKLVEDAPTGARAREHSVSADTAQRVFDHWVWMLGKNPLRTAFGPERRKAVAKALALYDEETLCMAIEGCAASAWHQGENDRGRAFNDLELIIRNEAHVERFADDGERLRQRALRDQARARAQLAVPPPVDLQDEAAKLSARSAVRKLAATLAGRPIDE